MKATHKRADEAISAREENLAREVGVRFQTEMVIREDVIIPFSEDGTQTLGEMLDTQLMHLAGEGGEPRTFSFTFTPESWEQAKPAYLKRREEEGWQRVR